MQFRLGELFSGPGGLAWGALHAEPATSEQGKIYTIKHAWANDMDPCTCETYARNIPLRNAPPESKLHDHIISVADWRQKISYKKDPRKLPSVICGSVHDLDPVLDYLPKIDALAFGFPCNDFSYVGERRGLEGVFGPLYRYGVKVLNKRKPKWFIAENVEGLLHDNKGKTFLRIFDELSSAGDGYIITPHLYRFEEYGVPQCRARLVMVGISRKESQRGVVFRVPKPPLSDSAEYISAFQALELGLGTLPPCGGPIAKDAPNHSYPTLARFTGGWSAINLRTRSLVVAAAGLMDTIGKSREH